MFRTYFRKSVCLTALLLVCLVYFFPVAGVETSSDSGSYLLNALRLYAGKEYDFTASWKGPVFPALIAGMFHVTGVSVFSAMLLVRLFWALNIVLTFWIGTRLFGFFAGVTAAFLVLSSFVANYSASCLLLDVASAFFLLLSAFYCYIAVERASVLRGVIAGMLLGFTFLLKQTGVLLLPLPLLLWLFHGEFRTRRTLVAIAGIYLAFLVLIVPWAVYLSNQGFGLWGFLGSVYHKSVQVGGETRSLGEHITRVVFLEGPAGLGKSLWRLTWKGGYSLVVLVSVIAWLALGVRYIARRKSADLFLILSLACFLPVVVASGQLNWRLGQLLFGVILVYAALAAVLDEWVFKKAGSWKDSRRIAAGIVVAGIFCLQVIPSAIHWEKVGRVIPVMTSKNFRVTGRHASEVQVASAWISGKLNPGDAVITDGYIEEAVPFYTRQVFDVKYFLKWHTLMALSRTLKGTIKTETILAIWPNEKLTYGNPSHREIFVILKKEFAEFLLGANSDYFMSTKRSKFYWTFFWEMPWASTVFDDGNLRIYHLNREQMQAYFSTGISGVFIDRYLADAMAWLRENDKDHYRKIQAMNLNDLIERHYF